MSRISGSANEQVISEYLKAAPGHASNHARLFVRQHRSKGQLAGWEGFRILISLEVAAGKAERKKKEKSMVLGRPSLFPFPQAF